jgi:hypothetical protein
MSKVYINPSIATNIKSKNVNPSIASNIKSISQDSCSKQRCSRDVKSLHQSVNRFQYQINQPRQLFEITLFPEVKSLHQSVNRFQYQINQPRQFV